jgi:hypothetical protein
MFYKSSLLALTVVLLAAGSAMAKDVSLVQDDVLGQKVDALVRNVDVVRSETLSDRVEHSLDAGASSEARNTVVVAKVPAVVDVVPMESGEVKDWTNQLVAGTNVSNFTVVPQVDADVLPDLSVMKVDEPGAAVPTSLEMDLTKKWEISDAVALNEVLLTPPSERVVQVAGGTVESEPKKWAVGIHAQASTTGFVGVDVGYKFSPNLHGRLGVNAVGFNTNYSSQGIDYNASFSPTNVHFLGDYFPFGGGLRLTGGLVVQSNQFNGTGTPSGASGQINLGGTNYNASDVGTLSSEGSFSNSVAPYLGIGFGTPLSPGLGFNLDAGVMFAGSPTVRLRANNISPLIPAAQQQQIRSDLAKQESQTNKDISGFNVYPVISIGVSYAF